MNIQPTQSFRTATLYPSSHVFDNPNFGLSVMEDVEMLGCVNVTARKQELNIFKSVDFQFFRFRCAGGVFDFAQREQSSWNCTETRLNGSRQLYVRSNMGWAEIDADTDFGLELTSMLSVLNSESSVGSGQKKITIPFDVNLKSVFDNHVFDTYLNYEPWCTETMVSGNLLAWLRGFNVCD